MGDNASELKVAITTTADVSGVVAQTQAFKELEVGASKTYDAIAVAQAKQEQAEKFATAESRSAQQEAAQTALRQIEAQEKIAKSGHDAETALHGIGHATKELSSLGHEATGVMEGLSRGGLDGLAQAGANAGKIIRTTLTTSLGAPLLAALSGAGALMYALKVIANDATKEIQRGFDRAAASAKRHTEAMEANKVAAEKSLKAQQKDVAKLAHEWEDLGNAVEASHARTEKVNTAKAGTEDAKVNLEEQQALATAKTPEQRESISRRFAGVRTDQKNKQAAFALDQQESFANDNERAAQTQITDADSAFRAAQAKLAEKQVAKDASTSAISNFTPGTRAHEDATEQAKKDTDALKLEKENFEKVIADLATSIKAAEAKIAEAASTRTEVAEKRKGLAFEVGAEATQRANESRQRLTEAQQPLTEIAGRRQEATQKLKGLEDDNTRSLELGGNKETIAAIEAAKSELKQLDAEQAKAQEAYGIAQKEASVAQLKQTQAQRADAAKAAEKQLSAQEGYHAVVVEHLVALQQQLDAQAEQIKTLKRARKADIEIK